MSNDTRPLEPEVIVRLRDAVDAAGGDRQFTKRCGLAPNTIARALAGLPIHPWTRQQIERALEGGTEK